MRVRAAAVVVVVVVFDEGRGSSCGWGLYRLNLKEPGSFLTSHLLVAVTRTNFTD